MTTTCRCGAPLEADAAIGLCLHCESSTAELFPRRRYVVRLEGDTAGGRLERERQDAVAHARAVSEKHPGSLIVVDVIEEAEPIGLMRFRGGKLLETRADAR